MILSVYQFISLSTVKYVHGLNDCSYIQFKYQLLVHLVETPQLFPIDLMQLTSSPHITKRRTDSGRKSAYYAASLSGKNYRGLWSLSTVEQFASSFLTSAGSDFTFIPRMHKISTGPNAY